MSVVFVQFFIGVTLVLLNGGSLHASNTDEHQRLKREIECDAKYREITAGHSACKQPSDSVTASGVSDENKQTILDAHNTARRSVSPTASNMMLMTWDDEIANTAQRWAENCVLGHDGSYDRYAYGRFSVGQNLAMGQADWSSAIKAWEDEKDDYDFTTNRSPNGKEIGHYTQMVWAKSSKIGCGYARCHTTNYYVCNYGPGGNSGGDKPYVSGQTCSACPNKCNNGLCDCGGVVCLNGGEIDYNTCTCNCKSNLPFYLAPTCGLNCELNKEASWCNQYGVAGCKTYTNVPQECPLMCSWCPTAAYKPEDKDTTVSPRPTDRTDSTESSSRATDSTPRATDRTTTTAEAHTIVASAFISLFVVLIPCIVL
ncbi:cysteine-rich venom protein-like isoform X2 [Mercenaria mercenaria]|uniref:cysteine-rich venom protein-like isoform X2 n=1 Tax=Mercenaria mercenaria TaxID=6596 RepID=UPI00234FA4F9|nr:cysteine-rich venom protein-like isoform X2 [Mercenaria mercenaria]